MGKDKATRITISQRTASETSTVIATPPLKEFENQILDFAPERAALWVRIRRQFQDAFSEFFGTFIFLLFSFGVTAQVTLSESTKGDYVALCLGWG
jgi:hypothetical protein